MDWKTFVICLIFAAILYEGISKYFANQRAKILKDLPAEKIKAIAEYEKNSQ